MPNKPRVPRPQPAKASSAVEHYFRVLDDVRASRHAQPVAQASQIDIKEEIAREQKLKNDDAAQNIELKRKTLRNLFRFLAFETACIFVFAFLQAIHKPDGFHLEEWSFKVVVGATILQIAAMLHTVVKYLFPKGR